ncbi:Purine catabolism regulatory protein-like family protein [Amycolatopsis marina]|uniref:Purine catabolism regulatory protein-like family protein n=1 Tax=Amycolatopsis marina TaxID=490629 RepID=A0A1I1B3Q0_9PSEU|nr:Purine catabolism regulatory protein-like family protein [Amycolatopsis marina]
MDVPSLGLRVLVPGSGEEPGGPDPLDTSLRWLHNTELLDPSGYVRDRELVLTNGLWHDGANAAEFVSNVVRASGAGIVFGLLETTPVTPPDLVRACAAERLPLVELSVTVPFTEVTRQAAAQLAGQRQRELVDTVRRGNDLAAAISRGAGATGVLKVLRRDHRVPLAVIDRMGRVLAADGARPDAEDARRVAEGLKRHPPPLELDLGPSGMAALFLVNTLGGADAALVCLRSLDLLGETEREALTQAAHYLSLEVARTELMRAIESRFAHELLEMILSGSRAAGEVAGRLEAFGIRPDGPLVVAAVALRGEEAPSEAALAKQIGDLLAAEGIPAVVVAGSQDIVAIFPWDEHSGAATELARRIVDSLRDEVVAREVVVGIGGVAENSRELRPSLRQARDACLVLRRGSGRPVAHFAELSSHRLLLGAQDEDVRRRFADSVLGPLRRHDTARGAQLETTVRAFLEHDGHWAATAAELYIHVNTLRNRLAKVAELTGNDVSTTEGRVDVFLALEADALTGQR